MSSSYLTRCLFLGLFLNSPAQAGSNNDLITIDANGRPSPALHLISSCINDHTLGLDAKTRYTVQRSVYAGFRKLRHQNVTKTYHLSKVMITGYNELRKMNSKNIITIKNWGVFNRRIAAALQCGASHPAAINPDRPPIMVINPPVKGNGNGSRNTVKPSKPVPPKPRNNVNKPPRNKQVTRPKRSPMVYKKFGGGVVTFSCKGKSSPSINAIQHCIEKQLKHDASKNERDLLRQTVANGLKKMAQGHIVRVTSIKDTINIAANKSRNLQFRQHLKSLLKKHGKKLESCGKASGTAQSCKAKSSTPWGKRIGGKRVSGKRVSGKRIGTH